MRSSIILSVCFDVHRLRETRKYRILDDCSRMRDIVRGLPSERPFVPSLLCLSWSEDERLEANSEMMDMVCRCLLFWDEPVSEALFLSLQVIKLEHQGILASYHSLSLTSDPASLDNKFREALALLKLDVTGSLAEVLPLRG